MGHVTVTMMPLGTFFIRGLVISIGLCTKFDESGFAVFAAHLCLIQCSLPFLCVVVRLHCSFALGLLRIRRCGLLLDRAYYRLALTAHHSCFLLNFNGYATGSDARLVSDATTGPTTRRRSWRHKWRYFTAGF